MLTNYLKIALRTLRRHRAYSFINVAGLAVGMAAAVLILLYVQDERSYDRYHVYADRMYRLVTGTQSSTYEAIAKVPGPWGPAVLEDVPEVERAVRFRFLNQTLVSRGEARFYESGAFYADASVFEVFSFPLLRGDAQTALAAPGSVVLTQRIARKYFGQEDPLGRTLTFDSRREMTVTGVMADVPANSHFTFPFLVSRASETDSLQYDWVRLQYYTYLLLKEGAAPEAVAAKVPAVLARHLGPERAADYGPRLQAVPGIHLHSALFREMAPNANVAYVYLFSVLAFFILLIACINFMNLTTARSVGRAREVGVRKASGARRGALIGQFLGESMLLSFVALALALALVSLLLPAFNALTGKALSMNVLSDGSFALGLLGIAVFVGITAGSYPAFVLSSFRPADVLKGQLQGAGGVRFRKALVVFQFVVSAFFIVAVGAVESQVRYIQSKNLGYNHEHLVIVPIREEAMRQQAETFKQELLKDPGVVRVAASANLPGGGDFGIPLQPEGFLPEEAPSARILAVDPDFLETYEMDVVAGRSFSGEHLTDAGTAFILNESAAKAFGWEQPLGKRIGMEGVDVPPSPVIGVVKDFHFRSMREEIGPLVFFVPPPNWFVVFSVRLRPEAMEQTLAFMERTWARFEPHHPFTYSFLDQQLAALHQSEVRVGRLLGYATALAVLIACLGLFGLAAFTAEQRTKEIGVRKVLGASVSGLVLLLSKDFARLVVVALLLAVPLAYVAMDRWLDGFAYRVALSWRLFLLAGLLALLVALLTVSYQAVRAALADPVAALRYE